MEVARRKVKCGWQLKMVYLLASYGALPLAALDLFPQRLELIIGDVQGEAWARCFVGSSGRRATIWKMEVQFDALEANLVTYQMAAMLVGERSTTIVDFATFGSKMGSKMLQVRMLEPLHSGCSTDGG